jgi:hypothetical protein
VPGFRALIDPHKADLRPAPRDERDLMIKAANSWVIGLDNLSHVNLWLSDPQLRNDAADGDDDVFTTPSSNTCKSCGGPARGSGVAYLANGGLLCPHCGRN